MTGNPELPRGPRLRADLADLPAYKAGQRPAERPGLITYKISSNENPYPPLPRVLETIATASREIHRYPDPTSSRLVHAIAARFGVAVDDIAVGTGSVAVCGHLVSSVAGPGDEVLYAWRSFEAYPIVTQIAGATSVRVPLTATLEHDLDAMADAITDRTRLVFLCSPNNPTGPSIRRAPLARFLARVPDDVLVVLDEAYREFNRDPEVPDGVELMREHPNLAVLRTFSKAYGLAALRVGFTIAPTAVADYVRRTSTPFGVSSIAEAAAVASLADEDELLDRVQSLVDAREKLVAGLHAQGWRIPDTQANFLWLPLGASTEAFVAACDEVGLSVRGFAGEGARVTVAEDAANQRLLEVCAAYVPAG